MLYELLLRAVLVFVAMFALDEIFHADVTGYFLRSSEIGVENLPYRDFLWEYPPLGALPLALIPVTGRSFDGFFLLFVTSMVTLEYLSLRIIRKARPAAAWDVTVFWTFAVLPVCLVAWFRLDLIPTFLATVAMVALVRGRFSVWPIVAGFSAKLWPVVFLVPMFLHRRWRALAFSILGCASVLVLWYAFSPEGFMQFLSFRKGAGFQVESIPGALLLTAGRDPLFRFGAVIVTDAGWEWVQTALNVVLIGFPAVAVSLALWRGPSRVDVIALTGSITTALLMSTRLLSPQFLIWLAPFIAWLWPNHRTQGFLYGAIVWLTVVVLNLYDFYLTDGNLPLQLLLNLRNLLLVVLSVVLLVVALRSTEEKNPDDEHDLSLRDVVA